MRYHLSGFRQNFFGLMRCSSKYSLVDHVFKTTIDNTEIEAKANHLDHITTITIRTQLSSGMFASNKTKSRQLETHIKCYVMAIGCLIDLDKDEFEMLIANMMRTIPYSGKGLISEQHVINNGWEITIRIPVSNFETRLYKYNTSAAKYKTIASIESYNQLYVAEKFIFNFNQNLQVLESNKIQVNEVNIGELDKNPILLAQLSDETVIFLQLEADYKHFTCITMAKMKKESVKSFTQKELATLLYFVPDKAKAASIYLDNFLNDEIPVMVDTNGKKSQIKILLQQDPEKYIFSIVGGRT